jgi:peptidoglycan/LPS O-acetylase OafA/YrhL
VSLQSSRSLAERFYHPELDVLRFFAFFMAFVHHSLPHHADFYTAMGVAPALAYFLAGLGATGAFGVNLFFLLSSYLITELLIRERLRFGHVDLRAFYVRRVLRIWPLYFAFLGFAWILQWYVPTQHIGWRAGLAFVFLSGNWWVVFVGFPASVIFPLWSLSCEEQFYIVWPALMRRLSERGMILAAAAMLVMANLTRWYLAVRHTWESKLWTNTFVQLDGIALGILLAVLLAGRMPRLAKRQRMALFAAGVVCFAIAANYFRVKDDPLTVSRVLLGYFTMAVGAIAVFVASLGALGHRSGATPAPRRAHLPAVGEGDTAAAAFAVAPAPEAAQPARRWALPSWRTWLLNPLIYLGRISYGLYVFHVLGLMITDYTIPHQTSSLGRYLFRDAVAFALATLFASISYRWLETPFLALKQRFFTHILSRPGG